MANPGDEVGFVEGIHVRNPKYGDEEDDCVLQVSVPFEMGKRLWRQTVILLTLEEWNAMKEARDE